MKTAGILVGTIVGFIVAGAIFVLVAPDPSQLPLVQALGSAGILISASIVAFTYEQNSAKHLQEKSREESRLVTEAAIEFLKHAYHTLTKGNTTRVPPNDRISWLTAARHLLTAQELVEKITDPTHKLVYEEQLEFWRTELYKLLSPLGAEGSLMDEKYFADEAQHAFVHSAEVRAPIDEKSLAVVFRFIQWPDDRPDRLASVDRFTDEEIDRHSKFGHRGLASFLSACRKYEESLRER